REINLVAVIVAEPEPCRLDLEAAAALHEPAPVGAAAELPVGRDLETGLLLQAHDIADGLVLDIGEGGRIQLAPPMLAEGVAQRLGTQQAADVIGSEGRSLGRCGRHGFLSPLW